MLGPEPHPFFDPLWRRVGLIAICLTWAGVEFYHDKIIWGVLVLAITAQAAWSYLLKYKRTDATEGDPADNKISS